MKQERGSAHLGIVSLATGVTATLMALAGVAQETDTVNVPVSIGGFLQLLAIGGIAVIWWLVRGAFNDLRDQVRNLNAKTDGLSDRVASLEGFRDGQRATEEKRDAD
jgi:hypothetical protein